MKKIFILLAINRIMTRQDDVASIHRIKAMVNNSMDYETIERHITALVEEEYLVPIKKYSNPPGSYMEVKLDEYPDAFKLTITGHTLIGLLRNL